MCTTKEVLKSLPSNKSYSQIEESYICIKPITIYRILSFFWKLNMLTDEHGIFFSHENECTKGVQNSAIR